MEIAPTAISYSRRLILRASSPDGEMIVGFVSPKCTSLSYPGRSAARSGALQTRDRFSLWRSRISDAPLRWRSRCVASGTHDTDGPCIFLFFCRFGIFHPRSHDLKHTHLLVPAAHLRPSFCILASLTPNRGVGGAPRNVRVQRHPCGMP